MIKTKLLDVQERLENASLWKQWPENICNFFCNNFSNYLLEGHGSNLVNTGPFYKLYSHAALQNCSKLPKMEPLAPGTLLSKGYL